MEAIVISQWSSISSLGCTKSEVVKNALSDECFLFNETFNNKQYRVGRLSLKSEQSLTEFLAINPYSRKVDRSVQLALFSANELAPCILEHARDRIGVSIGSSRGATQQLEQSIIEQYRNSSIKTSLLTSPMTTSGNLASSVANFIGAEGLVVDHSMTCSTAFQAITNAIAWIRAGFADVVIAGGSEAPLTQYTIAQLEALGIYSNETESTYPCRPLSNDENKRNTMTLGEGAVLLVIERKEISEIRKGSIIIKGIGFSTEKVPSLTGMTENGEALQRSMRMAMNQNDSVDLIITHTPGTIKGDNGEMNAIKQVFGEKHPPVYANKWKIGHTYGASAAFSLVSAIASLSEKQPLKMPYRSYQANIESVIPQNILINSAGFGGNASSILVSMIK